MAGNVRYLLCKSLRLMSFCGATSVAGGILPIMAFRVGVLGTCLVSMCMGSGCHLVAPHEARGLERRDAQAPDQGRRHDGITERCDVALADVGANDAAVADAVVVDGGPNTLLWSDDFELPWDPMRYPDRNLPTSAVGARFMRLNLVSGNGVIEVIWGVERQTGWLWTPLGAHPLIPGSEGAEKVQDLYWRARVMHSESSGWPAGREPTFLSVFVLFDSARRRQVQVDMLITPPESSDDPWLVVEEGLRCGTPGAERCTEVDRLDPISADQPLVGALGPWPEQTWRCLEGHLRLNTPGSSDGELAVFADGVEAPLGRLQKLNWRDDWDEWGINAVQLQGWLDDPGSGDGRLWLDDFALDDERIGCP